MIFEINYNIAIVHQNQSSVLSLNQEFEQNFELLQSKHVILCLDETQQTNKEFLSAISDLSNKFENNNRSFVVVSAALSSDDWPEYIALAPTQQEAKDIIEMDEMQRDLGF
jgi:hypothetical protein